MVPGAVNSSIGDHTYTSPEPSNESVIRVFSIPAINWILTVVMLLSASHHILQAIKSRQRKDQINNIFHALMHVLMAAMLWHLAPSTMLAQIAVLTGAALWFIFQAVARPEVKILCTNGPGRLKCVYHSLAMAGAALMIAMMGGVTASGYAVAPTSGMPMSHDHHTMTAPVKTTAAAATMEHSPNLAIVLTVFFAAAAMVFVVLLLRLRAKKTTHNQADTPKINTHKDHGLEALGAVVMALMFATMTT